MSTFKKIVLVTGGNNGIGFATCQLFANQPNYHVIMGSRSREKGQEALSTIKASNSGSSISLVNLDIVSDVSIAAAVQEVRSQHGHIDVLINNAGICPIDFSRSILRETIETNAISPAMVTQAFSPLLLRSPTPRVIYVSSILGSTTVRGKQDGMAYNAAYKAYRTSKAALNMLTACDAFEYQGKMKVFAFCPGYVISDLAGQREIKEKQDFARSPGEAAREILAIAEGEQDAKNGLFLHGKKAAEVYEW